MCPKPTPDVNAPRTVASPSIASDAYAVWLSEAHSATARQQPVQLELVAEHYLMGAVLEAMAAEGQRIECGSPLRTGFWSAAIEFNGNFVYACHRLKEDTLLIPALVKNGGLRQVYIEAVEREHDRAKHLTLSIRDGVEEGDPEKVKRLVAMYVSFLRPHMQHEELELFGQLSNQLPTDVQSELRRAFTRVEREALPERGRHGIVELAKGLLESVGVDYPL